MQRRFSACRPPTRLEGATGRLQPGHKNTRLRVPEKSVSSPELLLIPPKAGSVTGRRLVTQNKPHVRLWYSRVVLTSLDPPSPVFEISLLPSRGAAFNCEGSRGRCRRRGSCRSSVCFPRGDPSSQGPPTSPIGHHHHMTVNIHFTTTNITTIFADEDNTIHTRQYHRWRQWGDDRGDEGRGRSRYLAPARSLQVRVHKRRHCA